MSEFRHGHTNLTTRTGPGIVHKTYSGADAAQRRECEAECLSRLGRYLPVPEIVAQDRRSLTLREAIGAHGQDLMDAGHANDVLEQLGHALVKLQTLTTDTVPSLKGPGAVIVHGDFGPQNVLMSDGRIVALLDWEFAHRGEAIEDLAWAEWIVRMHHPSAIDSLDSFFSAVGTRPSWTLRQEAMVDRCSALLMRVTRDGPGEAIDQWRSRVAITEAWAE